jgi:hypothetical protein
MPPKAEGYSLAARGPFVQHSKIGLPIRFGSKADIGDFPHNVRFTPESGHRNSLVECLLCAKGGHQRRKPKVPQNQDIAERSWRIRAVPNALSRCRACAGDGAGIPLKAPAANPAARLTLPFKSLVSVAHRAHNASTIRVFYCNTEPTIRGVLAAAYCINGVVRNGRSLRLASGWPP